MKILIVLLFLICGAAFGQNRTCPTGTSVFPIQYGDKVDCSLTSGTHRHQFQAAANDVVGLHIVRTAGNGGMCVAVENSGGVVLMARICGGPIAAPGNRDAIPINSPGIYTIVVSESGNSFESYQYSLVVERLHPPTMAAQLLLPNATIRGGINPRGDRDLYQFKVQQGDRFAFRLVRTAGTAELRMQFIDQFGAPRTLLSERSETASTSGTFALWVFDSGGNDVGEYEVTLLCQGTCPGPPPVVTGITNAANPNAGLCRGAFAAIYGDYFSTISRTWERRDFVGNALPVTVEGARAGFGDLSSYAYYVSPKQMNVILPAVPTGRSELKVRNPNGESPAFDTNFADFCPALFMFPAQRYVVAVYPDGTVAQTPSVTGRGLRPGDVISLFGTGFGATVPAYPEGELLPVPLATSNPVTVQIGGAAADVLYSGLIGPGLYQINVRVPVVSVGEQPIRVSVGGVMSPAEVSILVAQP